ncbi:OmpA family protein [Candidatus Babeliales bacterium]|nr:OmpA family protein [Candidatus Babeliales bacterium]
MKKLTLLGLALVVLVSGCGKKKDAEHCDAGRKFVHADTQGEIPVYTAENEELFDDASLTDFAFVNEDEENLVVSNQEVDNELANAADRNAEEDADLLVTNEAFEEDYEFQRVHFDFNQNEIKNDQKPVVATDCKLAKKAIESGKTVTVQGHTCQMGSAGYNLALSQRRAQAVKKEMVAQGLPKEKIKTIGLGYESPLVWTNETDRDKKIEALSANRRAEVVLEDEQDSHFA